LLAEELAGVREFVSGAGKVFCPNAQAQ